MTQWTLLPLFLCPPFSQLWNSQVVSQLHTYFSLSTDIPGVSLGVRHSAGLCISGPQFTLETSHSTWVTPEFKSILSQDLATQPPLWKWKRRGSASRRSCTETDFPKDQFRCRVVAAKTVGGEVNLGATDQGSVAPLLAFSPREAKSEILALSRDS